MVIKLLKSKNLLNRKIRKSRQSDWISWLTNVLPSSLLCLLINKFLFGSIMKKIID
jgi:uncharacterized membrane protein YhaH (DUF805 family)